MTAIDDLTRHYELLHDERNSLLYWYPKVKDVAPTPRSVWLEIDLDLQWLEDGVPDDIVNALKRLATKLDPLNPYPLFMRTDVNSGKHNYVDTCYVGSEEDMRHNLYNLIVDTFLKDLLPRAIVLREFVELDWRFRAFSGKLPIAPEVRVMVRDGAVERWFFYWPEDAILLPDRPDWRELLAKMKRFAEREQEQFLSVAREVARKLDGYWSVDFARTRDAPWILIDMALGEVSWRPELTENCNDAIPDLKELLELS